MLNKFKIIIIILILFIGIFQVHAKRKVDIKIINDSVKDLDIKMFIMTNTNYVYKNPSISNNYTTINMNSDFSFKSIFVPDISLWYIILEFSYKGTNHDKFTIKINYSKIKKEEYKDEKVFFIKENGNYIEIKLNDELINYFFKDNEIASTINSIRNSEITIKSTDNSDDRIKENNKIQLESTKEELQEIYNNIEQYKQIGLTWLILGISFAGADALFSSVGIYIATGYTQLDYLDITTRNGLLTGSFILGGISILFAILSGIFYGVGRAIEVKKLEKLKEKMENSDVSYFLDGNKDKIFTGVRLRI